MQEAVRSSPHRHKPLPDVHNVKRKGSGGSVSASGGDGKSDRGRIWTPPNEDSAERPDTPSMSPSTVPDDSPKAKG